MTRMDMTEVGGKRRQAGADVRIGLVRVDDGADGEGVSEVVDARAAVRRARPESYLTNQSDEVPTHVAVQEPGSSTGDEQTRRRGVREQAIAFLEIDSQGVHGGGMQREFA